MNTFRRGGWTILVALVFSLACRGEEPTKERRAAKVGADLYGDPLPKGAIARLGSVRFRHQGTVMEVAFSADGKLLAASSNGLNVVILWERATGRKLREIRVGAGPHPPSQLRFSSNGKRLYGSGWYGRDMKLNAWNVAAGAEDKEVPPLPNNARILGYSPDGRELILLHREAEVVRWDVDKGKERGRYSKPGDKYLSTAALVGERVLVPYFDGQAVGMWDAAQKKQLWSIKATREREYPSLPMAFSADGKLFALEIPPKKIAVYDSVTGKLVRRLEGEADKIYWSLSFSPDARTVAGGNWDGCMRLWDVDSGRQRGKTPMLEGSTATAYFAPDSKVFATGGPNNAHSVLLWDTATGKRIEPYPGHASPVTWLSFSPDGRTAATCSDMRGDAVVRIWETRTGRLLRSIPTATGWGGISSVAFSPDGGALASCGWVGDNKMRIWDVRAGRQRHELTGHEAGCTCVAFAPDGKRVASGDAYYNHKGKYGGRLCIWDAESGKRLHEIRGTRGAIQQVLFTRDGRHVLAAADGIHVYDADTGRPVGEPFQMKTRVWRLALSADGRLLATCDCRESARLWELATRREIALAIPAAPDARSSGIALTPDGRTLAASDSNGSVVLFHWPSGKTVGELSSERDVGTQVFFSPDGRRLATADNSESSVLIWDVANLVNRPLPTVAKATEADLRRWWAELRDDNPSVAYKAVWRFVAVREQTLPFLAKSLQPIEHADQAAVARWIADLDSNEFKVREKALRELARLGEVVVDALRKAKKSGITLEQRLRIDRLLAELPGPIPGPEQLRAIRAAAILEQIGGAEARKVLAGLAAGAAGARLTEEAQAAWERLKQAERKP